MNPSPQAAAPTGLGPVTVGALVAGRYRVTARLGAGGMATIYRALDESLERDVAIKVLQPHLADDDSLLARFRAEARAAAGLLHPHIVNVFDQGVADLPYIVMEYVDGPSLREVLTQRERLSPGEALAIIAPVCAALARAHAAGVIHRDIKPENVLIASDGTVKVADFGIARALADTSHTATGTLVGSVHYLAPELMGGAESSAASDQYSVGVLLFELLTGRKPLPADTPMAVVMRHAKEKIPSVRQFAPDVPGAVDGVIARATATAPAKRYPDMATLAAALRDAVPAGPQRVVVSAEGDANGTLVIPIDTQDTVTLAKPAAKRGVRRRSPALTRPRKRRVPLLLLAAALLLAGGGFSLWHWVLAPVVPAPALLKLDEAAAQDRAAEAGLVVAVEGARSSVKVAQGRVLEQTPPPQASLRRGDTVTVVLSSGPDDVAVPKVVGQAADRAVEQLQRAPLLLKVTTKDVFSDDVPKGRVVSQAPAPRKTVVQGTPVTLRVSQGIEQVVVPAVVGSSRGEAEAALDDAKLRFATTQTYSNDHPQAGTVIAQSIEPKATTDKGTTVQLTVSLGPLHFALDDYLGQDVDQARAGLEALDLRVFVEEQARPLVGPTRQGSFGRVEAQVPGGGTTVKRGANVTLYTFSQAAEAAD